MRLFSSNRDEGKFKFVITVLIVAFVGFCIWKFIDARIRVYAYKDAMEAKVKEFGTSETIKPEDVIVALQKVAKEQLGVDLPSGAFTIILDTKFIQAICDYTIPVNFPLYQWDWKQHIDYTFHKF